MTDAQNFTDLDCALRCLKSVTEDLMEWVAGMAKLPIQFA
ncbi:Eaf protein [Salmonella enterica subsp. enterica serovar Cerro]|nr:Eaf protein [Salmonella enterica subsp. enterica serovar Cerro]